MRGISRSASDGASFWDGGSQNRVTDGPRESFTDEKMELFERRFQEGYDLFVDADYVRWLELHYP